MKLSLDIAQKYSNIDIKSTGIDTIIKNIGSQLGAIEEVIDIGSKYEGIFVARVVSCVKHQNADKLKVCLVDDGGVVNNVNRDQDGLVQVVCGAPNVREGLVVAWLPPGVVVPSTIDKDPFTLESREIRGVLSNGMLASPAELGISDDHEGLLEIDKEEVSDELTIPGTPFKNLYGLDDIVIDLENKMFTHRPDCFGILGIARELVGIQGDKFVSPEWYTKSTQNENTGELLELTVKVEDATLVPRFMAVAIDNVTVKPSPIWLQSYLTRLGIKPINNIVDLTNYYSYLTGQPLHAYDYEKVKEMSGDKPTIIARQARQGDEVLLLNGKSIMIDAPTVVIATDKSVLGIGGVMGGKESEVDNNTTKIILECANFDMYSIRRTSMKYGLFTDAVTRYTKGQSLFQCDKIISKVIEDINLSSGGVKSSEVFDIYDSLPETTKIKIGIDFINSRLGTNISALEMKQILENVEFEIDIENNNLTVCYPFWRQDIGIAEDIIEEIGRLYGYHNINNSLPLKPIVPPAKNRLVEQKNNIRRILSAGGANEVLTYTFIHGDLLKLSNQKTENSFELSNAISPDLQFYRQSVLPSVLSKVHQNIKSSYNEFALFELGKSHIKTALDDSGMPIEKNKLAFVYVCDDKIKDSKFQGSPYYQASYYLDYLLVNLGLGAEYRLSPISEEDLSSYFTSAEISLFDSNRSAAIRNKEGSCVGTIGEINNATKRKLKLPDYCAGFEIDINALISEVNKSSYNPLSKFPGIEQDLTVSVDSSVSYGDLVNKAEEFINKISSNNNYQISIKPIDIYLPKDSNKINFTIRLSIVSPNKTLVKEEANDLIMELNQLLINELKKN